MSKWRNWGPKRGLKIAIKPSDNVNQVLSKPSDDVNQGRIGFRTEGGDNDDHEMRMHVCGSDFCSYLSDRLTYIQLPREHA
jgi:hypothetical protein